LFNIITVVFDGPPPPFIVRTLRDGTPQVQIYTTI